MHLEIIRTLDQMRNLESEWNDLLVCCSASHVPFLRYEYLITWWGNMGGGEWEHGELNIVTSRDETGHLVAIAPLFLTHNDEGEPALMLLGSVEISDYLDMIVSTTLSNEFMYDLLSLLERENNWQVLDLYNIQEDSPTLAALQAGAEKMAWRYTQGRLQHCPYIPLPGDWEAYLASLQKKQRHELRRKIRRAESYPDPVRWYFVNDGSKLDQEMDDLFTMMSQDALKAQFLTRAMRTQLLAMVHEAFRYGWLQLAFLRIGDKKAAAYLNFDYEGHIWVYNSGINYEFGDLSPGWVLLGYMLMWANENKRIALDFMRGDEDYKYRFGAIDRFVVRACIRRS